jgi:hypothetical protein
MRGPPARGWSVVVALALAVSGGCDGIRGTSSTAKDIAMTDVGKFDELIGTPVLAGKPAVQAHIHRPSPQLALYEAYARFDGDEAAFRSLVSTLALGAAGTASAGGHLPAVWRAPDAVALSWWDAMPETPAAAAARPFGSGRLDRGQARAWPHLCHRERHRRAATRSLRSGHVSRAHLARSGRLQRDRERTQPPCVQHPPRTARWLRLTPTGLTRQSTRYTRLLCCSICNSRPINQSQHANLRREIALGNTPTT